MKHKRIKDQLMFIIIGVMILLTVIYMVSERFHIKIYDEKLYSYTRDELSFVTDEIQKKLGTISGATYDLATNRYFQSYLRMFREGRPNSRQYIMAKNEVNFGLQGLFSDDMYNVLLYPAYGETVCWGYNTENIDNEILETLKQEARGSNGRAVWGVSNGENHELYVVREIRSIENPFLEHMGYIGVRLNTRRMVNAIFKANQLSHRECSLYLYLDGRLVYELTEGKGGLTGDAVDFPDSRYLIKTMNGAKRFLVSNTFDLDYSTGNIVLSVSYDSIYASIRRGNIIYFASVLVSMVLLSFLASRLIKNVADPLKVLVTKMDRVKMGDFTVDSASGLYGYSKNELYVLNSYFDQMALDLKKLIDENYVKEILIKDAEFKALEQQVNPHFLYNTLNTVDWLAKSSGQSDISRIVESLAQLMRESLQGQDMITIVQEVGIIECYVEIQRYRFEELDVRIAVDERAGEVMIPKFSIQPLVENAIYYSREYVREQYLVTVEIEAGPEHVSIRVTNNGGEIPEDILDRLKRKEAGSKGNGVGLLNIDGRLRIIYGEASGLHFCNKNGWVTVGFQVPRKA